MNSFCLSSRRLIGAVTLSCIFSLTAFADGEMNFPVTSPGEMNFPVAAPNGTATSAASPGEMNFPLNTSLLASALQTLQNVLSIV